MPQKQEKVEKPVNQSQGLDNFVNMMRAWNMQNGGKEIING
jgi:hypothetical protein